MDSGERWRLGRRPALDGLRGVAIVLVLLAHFDNPATNPLSGAGAVGVTLFFTLSGFLITSLLLEQHERTGRLRFGRFYRRRALRLLPALYATTFAAVCVQVFWHPMDLTGGMLLAVLLSVSNLWQIHTGDFTNGLSHTWSLGIEEQFYLVWPAALAFAVRWGRRGAYAAAGAGALVSVGLVLTGVGDPYHGSLQRAFSLLAGCLLAVWMRERRERSAPGGWVAAIALLAMMPLVPTSDIPAAAYVIGVPVLTVAALWGAAAGPSPRWLSGPVLRWFGRRSYGIYLWHYVVVYAVAVGPGHSWQLVQGGRLVLSLVIAELSWWLIEAPFQRMRDRSGDPGDPVEVLSREPALGARAPR